MAHQLKPYRQGALDGLCGPYSVVNAIRFAIHSLNAGAKIRVRGQLDDDESMLLFTHLVEHLVVVRGSGRIFVEGIGQREMSLLLRAAGQWLRSHRSLRLLFKCPLRRRRSRKSTVLSQIAQHLSAPGTAAIIAGNQHWRHWTVATSVTRSRLMLFDSEGDEYVFIDRGARKWRYHAGLVHGPDLHLLSLSPETSRSVPTKRGPVRGRAKASCHER